MNLSRFPIFLPILAALSTAAVSSAEPSDIEKYRAASQKKWEKSMAEFDALNRSESHPSDSILFVGSSSIRGWKEIAEDMAPYHPIQRGFGGSRWSDVAVHADRIITPHNFRAAVFFVGNDISGKNDDKTPEEVAALFKYVLERVRAHNPGAPVFYVAVTPTAARWKAWPQIKAANTAARALCAAEDDTYFIGTESIFIDAEGNPRNELFKSDKLHQNREGYALWTAAIKAHLDTVLNGAK